MWNVQLWPVRLPRTSDPVLCFVRRDKLRQDPHSQLYNITVGASDVMLAIYQACQSRQIYISNLTKFVCNAKSSSSVCAMRS